MAGASAAARHTSAVLQTLIRGCGSACDDRRMPQDREVKHAHPDPATLAPRDPTQSLLTHLMTDTMDEDYAHVAQRRADSADWQTDGGAIRRRVPVGLMLVLILFGGLVVTAAVQTARNGPETQRERDQLVSEIHARSASVDGLRTETSTLQPPADCR